jgi:hypothetical protein
VTPRVTVLLVTCNDEPFLAAAIDSVLAQTFTNFELLIVDDASTDRSRAVAAAYRDPRMRVVANPTNLGAGASRNRGLATNASEYVAELDGNDICFPERLAEQVAYLDAHPDVALVGCQATLIDIAGRPISIFSRPTTDLGIRWCRIFQSPVIHSAVAYRRAVVWDELGGYEERFRFGEDFDLWRRLARNHVIRNLPQSLVAYRVDPESLTGTPRHPAREGYPARKASMILDNLREALDSDCVTSRSVACWLALGDVETAQSGEDVREAVTLIERSAARFASLHGDHEEVAAHQAEMLVRALRKAPAAGRLFMLHLWTKIWRVIVRPRCARCRESRSSA